MRKTCTFVVTIVNDADDLKVRIRSIQSGEQASFCSRDSLLGLLESLLAVERSDAPNRPDPGVRPPGGAARGKA